MTTPAGVPNLPIGALTVSTLGQRLQDFGQSAVKGRAVERVPDIFSSSTGGDIASDLSPFGIITNIWSAVNSLIAQSDPEDIQGPEDIPGLLTDFIESLPVIGAFVELFEQLLEIFNGDYDGEDETILLLQQLIAPLWSFLEFVFGEFIAGFITNEDSFLKHVFEWLGYFWGLFGEVAESVLNPILELIKWAWLKLDAIFGGTADQILRLIVDGIEWVWVNIGEPAVRALGGLVEFIASLIDLDFLKQLIEQITDALSGIFDAQGFADFLTNLFAGFADALRLGDGALQQLSDWALNIPFLGPLVSKLTGLDSSGDFALDLANLGRWASGLLTGASEIPAGNLVGRLSDAVFGTIPVSSINFSAGNLLSQGNFNVPNTVDPGDGWAWDGDTTATGTGGSVKATATGSLQQLYSRQTIRVAAGDRIDITAMVKTSGFTAASGRSMVLSVIPWIGTTAQTAHVVHTRTTAALTFEPMTGLRLRIGGTAESGEVALSGSITALTVRLAVTANSGAQIWFDNVEVKKAGALAQTLVEYLTSTWEQAWQVVFGGSGIGKIWSDFVTALSTVKFNAGEGVSKGNTALGNIVGVIDDIGKAIFGDSAYLALPQTVKQSIRKVIETLFGIGNPVQTEIQPAAVPDLDGSIITTGTVDTGRLDTDGIGAEINPTSGSGALLSRKDTANVNGNIGRDKFPAGFYTHLDRASTDISAMTTGGVPGTGARSDYSGIFRVSNAGWYMCEISVRLNASFAFGQKVAPALFKGTNLTNLTVFKIGADTLQGARYAQSTFIVYLNANETVQAGFDGDGYATEVFDADSSGVETYFSISLLNKTYA